jgi:hypothetical protein
VAILIDGAGSLRKRPDRRRGSAYGPKHDCDREPLQEAYSSDEPLPTARRRAHLRNGNVEISMALAAPPCPTDREQILACEKTGITVTLPKPLTSGAKAAGRFGKQDFVYVAAEDVYRCRAGERLTYRFTSEEDGKMLRRYWTTACQGCALKAQCTTGTERRIPRWEHEAVLERGQARLDRDPDRMKVRRRTAEHPFGTIKGWMGGDALPDAHASQGRHRDGAERARLQHEARHGARRRESADGGGTRIRGEGRLKKDVWSGRSAL